MAELGRRSILNAPHGTLAGYRMGCRCLWCQAACQAHLEPSDPARKAQDINHRNAVTLTPRSLADDSEFLVCYPEHWIRFVMLPDR